MRGIALVSFALIIAMPTLAETFTPQQINALNNLQEEYTTCGYYYRLQIACAPPGEGKEKLKSQLDPILTVCDRAVVLFGQGIGMTKDAIEQRLRRVAADMGRITNNNCVNMDSLAARYQTRCKQLIENPDAILDELRK
jgi:hypothetical protein